MPVCGVFVFLDEEPVKIYKPFSPVVSTESLIACHSPGASCLDRFATASIPSKRIGFSPFNSNEGIVFAVSNKPVLLSSS